MSTGSVENISVQLPQNRRSDYIRWLVLFCAQQEVGLRLHTKGVEHLKPIGYTVCSKNFFDAETTIVSFQS